MTFAAHFEELYVWQQAEELTVEIYTTYKDSKDRRFRDQICRASVSIMNNIAEGYERKTKTDRKRFMTIAKASSAEVRSMLHLAHKLGHIDTVTYKKLFAKCLGIGKMIYTFTNKL